MVPLALLAASTATAATPAGSAWGGTTLGTGGALAVDLGGGFDMDGLGGVGIGFVGAVRDDVDLGIALHTYAGVGTAVGGTADGRWSFVPEGAVRAALEVPVTVDTYVDGALPHLLVAGVEPGLALSTQLAEHTDLLYGVRGRLFVMSGVLVGGPAAMGGVAVRWTHWAVAVRLDGSELFVTGGPPRLAWSFALEVAWRWGG